MKNVFCGRGFTERPPLPGQPDDCVIIDAIRNRGYPLRAKDCIYNWFDNQEMTLDDLQWANIHWTYSWANRSREDLIAQGIVSDLQINVAAVGPDPFGSPGYFIAGPKVKKAVYFGAEKQFPKSEPFANKDAVWFDVVDPDLVKKILNDQYRVVNVNCDRLGTVHTNIQNHPLIVERCLELIDAVQGVS